MLGMCLSVLFFFQVFLSTRTGAWVISRSSGGGYPFNMMLTRRWYNVIAQVLPSCFKNLDKQLRLNHEIYGLRIAKGYLSFYFMGNLWFIFTNMYKFHVSVKFCTCIQHLTFKDNLFSPSFLSLISFPSLIVTILILASTYGNESAILTFYFMYFM